jgi:hypothetical protein
VARPELVRRKVATVAVQGGLVADASAPAGWAPDTSQNNEFDRAAAAAVYAFCFAHGLPLTVTSRHAVPTIPMQLARSFAERTACPVMRYLADAQFLGLEGLWRRMCAGELPVRCSKRWYFETFCHVDKEAFDAQGLDALDAEADIVPFLDGVVKPCGAALPAPAARRRRTDGRAPPPPPPPPPRAPARARAARVAHARGPVPPCLPAWPRLLPRAACRPVPAGTTCSR